MLVVCAASVALYAWSERQVDRANEVWQQTHHLADELRRSSDDLTRMVRTYVVTSDPLYKQHYQEILDIRDGRKPRPLAYGDIYWDLVLADDQRPRPLGPAVALLQLMRVAGFTDEEFATLAQAKGSSDALTATEFAAMALIENGLTAERRAEALRLLHGEAYHRAKADIMRPISEFEEISDARARQALDTAKNHAAVMLATVIVLALVLVSLLWGTRRSLYAILGGSVDELYRRIARLGSGNFSADVLVIPGRNDSVLGWLSQTQANLARVDAQRKRAEDEVGKRTRELSDSVLASLNMMEDAVHQRENAERAYAQLEQSHEQLLEASRRDGMAEVATNVLHNVGNVLNSVNVSASLVAENVKKFRAGGIAKVAALLREHQGDLGSYLTSDPKGRHIPAFVQQLADEGLEQEQAVVEELESLRTNIDHIKGIVALQQSHARVTGSAELVNVSDLVEDSLRMNADSLIKHEVRVVREFAEVAPISVEKHKVLQILVNLVRNAKQACNDAVGAKKRMTLRIAQA